MSQHDPESFNPYSAPLSGPEFGDPFQQNETRIRQQFIDCEANVKTIAGLSRRNSTHAACSVSNLSRVLGNPHHSSPGDSGIDDCCFPVTRPLSNLLSLPNLATMSSRSRIHENPAHSPDEIDTGK